MRFLGRDTPDTYSELISWDNEPSARSRLSHYRNVSPGEGLFIPEAQGRLYRFLIDASKGILHDIDLTFATIAVSPEAPEPPIPMMNKGEALSGSLNTL